MSLFGKIISIINLIYLIGIIGAFIGSSYLLAFVGQTIGVFIILLPILLGVISSIRFFIRKKKLTIGKWDLYLAWIPLINLGIILFGIGGIFLFG